MNIINAFMELDKLNESFDDRHELISKLKALGKNYYFDKYSDEQLYCMLEKAEEEKAMQDALSANAADKVKHTCSNCNTELTDGEFCPNCDDGRNDLVYEEFGTSGKIKSTYMCDECGFEVDMYDDEFDGCCPNCHDHSGGFGKCEEGLKDLFGRNKDKVEPVGYWEEPTTEVSNNQAVSSAVDNIKAGYEAGYFDKMPVGRENAATANLSGPDKDRLVAYFKKQPEFNYEMNTEQGIISHEFISDTLDIEVFDSFIQVYRIPQTESLQENNKINKEIDKMNFYTILEELDNIYEAEQRKNAKLTEDAEEILIDDEAIVDDEAEETAIEDDMVETAEAEEAPRQLVLECAKCGALVIKDEADIKIDEETDLANVDDACQYCEEAEGYKIAGEIVPYEGAVVAEEDEEEEEVTEALLEGKLMDNIKKVATRVGADAATFGRMFAELGDIITGKDTKFYDFMEYIENKAALKALMNGNEKVMNTLTKDDIEDIKKDIEEYKKAKANKKKANKTEVEECLTEDGFKRSIEAIKASIASVDRHLEQIYSRNRMDWTDATYHTIRELEREKRKYEKELEEATGEDPNPEATARDAAKAAAYERAAKAYDISSLRDAIEEKKQIIARLVGPNSKGDVRDALAMHKKDLEELEKQLADLEG
jgi:predicted RNA-binding Zn-ribbon protein involved in translation (DUF1610 family)